MGTLELSVLVDPNEKLDRKVLIVRKAGMKLFRLGNISRLVPFTGILELKGKNLNSYFVLWKLLLMIIGNPEDIQIQNKLNYIMRKLREWIRVLWQNLLNMSDDELDVKD